MKITYDNLKDLLRCNSGMKLEFRENTNILDVFLYNKPIFNIELENNSIEDNCDKIYNSIVSIENITMYIPKVYVKNK